MFSQTDYVINLQPLSRKPERGNMTAASGSAKVKNCGLGQNVKTLSFWTFIFLLVVSVKSIPDEGWYIADPEVSCDTACQKNNMLCTVDGMKAHNGDVDSPEKVLSLIKSLGEEFNEPTCHNDHGHYPVVPVFTKQTDNNYRRAFCFSSNPRKVQFSCSARPMNEGKQRLCYCKKASMKCYHCIDPNDDCAKNGGYGKVVDCDSNDAQGWKDLVQQGLGLIHDDVANKSANACLKSTIKGNPTLTIRSCMHTTRPGCRHVKEGDIKHETCICPDNLCNGSLSAIPGLCFIVTTIISSITMSIIFSRKL